MLLDLPSRAEEQRERIPDGCRELANRAGLPLTLTHSEAVRAIAYLSIMSSGDPAVVRCRRRCSAVSWVPISRTRRITWPTRCQHGWRQIKLGRLPICCGT